jgi:hypothetical protein
MYNPLYPTKPGTKSVKFNPIPSLDAKGSGVSTSAIYNNSPNTCPKCKKPYVLTMLESGEPVYFCHTDRVTAPVEE